MLPRALRGMVDCRENGAGRSGRRATQPWLAAAFQGARKRV